MSFTLIFATDCQLILIMNSTLKYAGMMEQVLEANICILQTYANWLQM